MIDLTKYIKSDFTAQPQPDKMCDVCARRPVAFQIKSRQEGGRFWAAVNFGLCASHWAGLIEAEVLFTPLTHKHIIIRQQLADVEPGQGIRASDVNFPTDGRYGDRWAQPRSPDFWGAYNPLAAFTPVEPLQFDIYTLHPTLPYLSFNLPSSVEIIDVWVKE